MTLTEKLHLDIFCVGMETTHKSWVRNNLEVNVRKREYTSHTKIINERRGQTAFLGAGRYRCSISAHTFLGAAIRGR